MGRPVPVAAAGNRTVTVPAGSIAVGVVAVQLVALVALPEVFVVGSVLEIGPELAAAGIAEASGLADTAAPISAARERSVGLAAAQAISYRAQCPQGVASLHLGLAEDSALDVLLGSRLPEAAGALEAGHYVVSTAQVAAQADLPQQNSLLTGLAGSGKQPKVGTLTQAA